MLLEGGGCKSRQVSYGRAMLPGTRWIVLFSTGLMGMLPVAASGAGDLDTDFQRRRTQFRTERRTAVDELRQIYLRELKALETFHATNEEYAKAIACRDARRTLLEAAREEAVETVPPVSGSRESSLTARGAGELQGFRRNESTGWLELEPDATEGTAIWRLPNLEPGGYSVYVDYLATAESTLLQLHEARFFVQGALSPLPEGAAVTRQSLGNLKVTDGGGTLRLVLELPEGQHRTAIAGVLLVSNAP
jgi:hypothetical protein